MKFLLALFLVAFCGTAVAWSVIDRKYGRAEVLFGVLDLDGQVTAKQIEEVVNLEPVTAFAKADLPDGSVYDFGIMQPDEKGQHEFRIRNAGDIPLTLRLGATSCKCTLGSLVNDQLGPGEETTVKMEWTVQTEANVFSQTAELRTNDPENPAVQLKVRGNVVRGVEIVPKDWTFGEIAAGEPIEMVAKVYNHSDRDIRPKDPSFSTQFMRENGAFEIEPFTPGAEDGVHAEARQGFIVTARVAAGMPTGYAQGNFMFGYEHLDEQGNPVPADPKSPDKTIFVSAGVSGRVVGILGMIPSAKLKEVQDGTFLFDLGRLNPRDEPESKALVLVKGSERDKIRLRVAEVMPAGVFDVSLEEPTIRASSALYRLVIRLDPGVEPIEKLGNHKDDYGWVLIDAENAEISPMRLLLKFSVSAR